MREILRVEPALPLVGFRNVDALELEDDFDTLFARRSYASIEEVIHEQQRRR